MTEATAALFVAHVLAAHLAVPEPVRLEVAPTCPPGFDGCVTAQVGMISGEWRIRFDAERFERMPDRAVRFVLAHELCHAAFDYPISTTLLPPKEHTAHERAADQCAVDILSRHWRCK